MKCPMCGKEVMQGASFCDSCGSSMSQENNSPTVPYMNSPVVHTNTHNKKPVYKKWWFWVIIVLAIVVVSGSFGSKDNKDNKENDKKSVTSTEKTPTKEAIKKETEKSTEAPKESTTEKITEKADSDNVPREYLNALEKAEIYSEHMHMSKKGIYDQLTSEYGEDFPEDAAQYAIDNIEADWNANALEKAKIYYEDMNMSKNAVYDQLTSEYGEQFTESEAQYAIDHLD